MKTQIFKFFFLAIMISCSKDKIVNNTPNVELNEKNENQGISETNEILLTEFYPQYILLTDNVFEMPDLRSAIIMPFSPTNFIQILEYGDQIKIGDEIKQWIKIRKEGINYNIGWCFITDIKKLKQPIEYNPMNNIDIKFVVLTIIDGNNRFKVEDKYSTYSCEYGMNKILLSFYNKNEIFDDEFQHNNSYYPKRYREMELCIDYDINIFPSIYFSANQRKITKNNITFVDAFMFCAHESQDQEIWRVIYFTTNNYDIEIIILIPGSSYNNDLIKKIMIEAPQYFLLYKNNIPYDYNGEDPRENMVLWDYKNDAIEKFGEDLRIGINPSKTLMQWYNETEKILESLRIE